MKYTVNPEQPHIDITAPAHVEIEIQHRRGDERVLYVHVEGITVLRICKIGVITMPPCSHSVGFPDEPMADRYTERR